MKSEEPILGVANVGFHSSFFEKHYVQIIPIRVFYQNLLLAFTLKVVSLPSKPITFRL